VQQHIVQAMSVTFEDAVNSLVVMFPSWDRDTLGELLVSNGNHVERTIETVLMMDGQIEAHTHVPVPPPQASRPPPSMAGNGLARQQTPYQQQGFAPQQYQQQGYPQMTSQMGANASYPQMTPQPHLQARGSMSGGDVKAAAGESVVRDSVSDSRRYRGRRVELPSDFLRVPGWSAQSDSATMGDEQLALMLQNELFQREVAAAMGQDFVRGMRGDPRASMGAPGSGPHAGRGGAYPSQRNSYGGQGGQPGAPGQEGIPDMGILKGLSQMGEAAKRNLSQMAVRFSSKNNSSAVAPGGRAEGMGVVGRGSRDTERTRLVDAREDEDGDGEFVSLGSGTRGGHALDDTHPQQQHHKKSL